MPRNKLNGLHASLMELHGEQITRKVAEQIQSEQRSIFDNILLATNQTIKDWTNLQVWLGEQPELLREEQRMIFCSLTGQPIGSLSLDIISMYQKARETDCPDKMLGHVALTCQPAPHWIDRSPINIKRNMRLDPWGFTVYMCERFMARGFLRLGKFTVQGNWAWRTPESYSNWQTSKIRAYQMLKDDCDVDLLRELNTLLLRFDGLIGLKQVFIPFGQPTTIANDDHIRMCIDFLKATLKEFFLNRGTFRIRHNIKPHKIHADTATLDLPRGDQESVLAQSLRDELRSSFGSFNEVKDLIDVDDTALDAELARRHAEKSVTVMTDLSRLQVGTTARQIKQVAHYAAPKTQQCTSGMNDQAKSILAKWTGNE